MVHPNDQTLAAAFGVGENERLIRAKIQLSSLLCTHIMYQSRGAPPSGLL